MRRYEVAGDSYLSAMGRDEEGTTRGLARAGVKVGRDSIVRREEAMSTTTGGFRAWYEVDPSGKSKLVVSGGSGRSRMHDPLASQSPPRLGC